MIISHKHKFIFIKSRKTAGTSVEIGLSALCGPEDIITPIIPEDESMRSEMGFRGPQNYIGPIAQLKRNRLKRYVTGDKLQPQFYHHIPAVEIKEHVGKSIWNSYFKFTIERNPFDKVVSYYYYSGGHEEFGSVSEFILSGGLRMLASYDLYAIDKVVAVDKIYRYEDLQSMERHLTHQLNLKIPFELPTYRAKGGHREKKNYKDVLDEEAVRLIEIIFAREMQLLGYTY